MERRPVIHQAGEHPIAAPGHSTETNGMAGDQAVIEACLKGHEDAWSALIDKYKNLIFCIPVRQGFSREDSCEIFQQVCLILLSELSRLREHRTLAAWLIRVTANECWHQRRKESRHRAADRGVNQEEVALPAEVENMLREFQREQTLREEVAEMATRCRRLIKMLFFTTPAVPYEQVAKSLGVARGSIGFIRMRCLERLRRTLEEKGFE
jgi:RNA polymerase sigma factor (sigma-70 family)